MHSCRDTESSDIRKLLNTLRQYDARTGNSIVSNNYLTHGDANTDFRFYIVVKG